MFQLLVSLDWLSKLLFVRPSVGEKQLLEITYPMSPPVAQALSFGSISHYLTIKIVKAGFHILCLCFTHCMSYSILNVNYQIRSVVHITETEDRQQNRRKGRQERQKGFKCF